MAASSPDASPALKARMSRSQTAVAQAVRVGPSLGSTGRGVDLGSMLAEGDGALTTPAQLASIAAMADAQRRPLIVTNKTVRRTRRLPMTEASSGAGAAPMQRDEITLIPRAERRPASGYEADPPGAPRAVRSIAAADPDAAVSSESRTREQ